MAATFLIIDDDSLFVDTLTFVLEQQEHCVLKATSGAAGIEMAQAHTPDLILCDVHMRNGHGYTTAQTLRERSPTEHIPIIMMTGKASPFGERRSRQSGADYYLSKPFSVTELLEAIRQTLQATQDTQRSSDVIFPTEFPG